MESINTFVGGMNKDASSLIQQKNTYQDALNISLITDNGKTQGALINYKGNEYSATIPDTSFVVEAIYTGGIFPTSGSAGFIINSIGKTVLRNGLTLKGFLEKLADEFNNDSVLQNLGIKVWINNQNTGLIFTAVKQFVNITYSNFISSPTDFQFTVKIPVQTDLEVIGWATIRDTIILLTTNHDTNDFNGIGQIWKLEINDKTDGVTNLELLYNNFCGFTKYHPMRRVIGRYETPEIQNIYFTDFHNKLRKFNTADPNGFTIDVDNLATGFTVNMDTPILTEIQQSGGSHLTGIVQYAYLLRSTNGPETIFSEPSHIIYINEGNDHTGNPNTDIKGSIGQTVNKAINCTINFPDGDYNRIEVYRLYRSNINSVPTITKIKDNVTPITGPYTFTDGGTENLGNITLDEFLDLKYSFTHCKELATKDNILFALNTRTDTDELAEYDARAFRYKLDSGNYVMDINNIGGISEFSITNAVPTNNQIPLEADCVIPDDDEYIYNHVGTLGGIGPNISFSFINYETSTEDDISGGISDWTDLSGVNPSSFFQRAINSPYNYTLDSSNRNYANKAMEATGAYQAGTLRGFQRGETYRFGIQFFNNEGKPYFVKWICDIKMPTHDPSNSLNTFKISGGANPSRLYNLGVIFNVNTSLIQDKISGYSIVRVKREPQDKTVLFSGLMNHLFRRGLTTELYRPKFFTGSWGLDGTVPDVTMDQIDSPLDSPSVDDYNFYIVSPELIINKTFNFSQGDMIYLAGETSRTFTRIYKPNVDPTSDPENRFLFHKFVAFGDAYYQSFDNGSKKQVIKDAKLSLFNRDPLNNGVVLDGANTFNTHVPTGSIELVSGQVAFVGGTCLFVKFDIPKSSGTDGSHKYVYYIRPNVNQYGGKGYENRSLNEYIACSRVVPIKAAGLGNSTWVYAFGGDTFVSYFDHVALFKDWLNGGITINNSPLKQSKYGAAWVYPCESQYNFDIRWYDDTNLIGGSGTGLSINRCGIDSTTDGIDWINVFGDDFIYQMVYSAENDIVKYLPKPLEFVPQEEFDCRIYASQVKFNGEIVDSWTVWKTNRFYDLESVYGPINGAAVIKDEMIVFQDRSFAHVLINPTALIQGITDLVLGNGSTIQTHKYISNDTGTKHQFSIIATDHAVYWLDILKRKFYRYMGQNEPLSDMKGLHGFFQEILEGDIRLQDNPIHQDFSGICGTYNRIKNEVIYTIKDRDSKQFIKYPNIETTVRLIEDVRPAYDNKFTIAFNEMINAFTSFYSFTPYIYINDGKRFFTPNPNKLNDLYMDSAGDFGIFYNTNYPTTIDIISNDKPQYSKTFDNLEILTEVLDTNEQQLEETFNSIICYTDYQQSNLITLTPNNTIKRKERTWQLVVPRNTALDRLRDKYLKIRLSYNNNNNKKLVFHLLNTIFRISSR